MKNRYLWIAASIATLLALSCTKEDIIQEEEALQIPVTIHARYGGVDTKVAYEENGAAITTKWDEEDQLLVAYNGTVAVLDLVDGAGTSSATFRGTFTQKPAANSILSCYVKDKNNPDALSVSGGNITSSGTYLGQDGTVAGAAKCNVYFGRATYVDGADIDCVFSVDCSILKFILLDVGAYKDQSATLTYTSGDAPLASASFTVAAGANTVFLAVPSGNFEGTQILNFACGSSISWDKQLSADHASFKAGETYSKTFAFKPQFLYSVSATKHVRFSPGNLQYQASTDTWRFAERQWKMVSNGGTLANVWTGEGDGRVKSDNALIAVDYSGWIDLFGWGTWTGYGSEPGNVRPTNGFKNEGTSYYRWVKEYDPQTKTYGDYLDFVHEDKLANESQRFYDWRTLSIDEWEYLLLHRPGNRFTVAYINEVKNGDNYYPMDPREETVQGMIIFPDGFEIPTEATDDFRWGTINQAINNYTYVTVSGWEILEEAGCVFLPYAGKRMGCLAYGNENSVYNPISGNYWSSTPYENDNENKSYYVSFKTSVAENYLYFADDKRYMGFSVRLVYDLD